ncbi:hypothetical protein KY290_030525 [Solanum tuberosum]|uniref:Zinc finger protein n=1 Tax=Solanum tuberosum TaxID=4113 RepID=A0ABQ7UNW8_SOLTU|nr:hypothetical protein KY289_027972 [Solanum tuberosum]KAH0751293.1 hypothetical protein KY290_030525 [Solanum tuberosum]
MPPVVVEELSEEEQKELLLNPPSRENVLCLQCDNGRKFKSVKDLLEHFRVVHADLPQNNKKLFCNDCSNLFRSPGELAAHRKLFRLSRFLTICSAFVLNAKLEHNLSISVIRISTDRLHHIISVNIGNGIVSMVS